MMKRQEWDWPTLRARRGFMAGEGPALDRLERASSPRQRPPPPATRRYGRVFARTVVRLFQGAALATLTLFGLALLAGLGLFLTAPSP